MVPITTERGPDIPEEVKDKLWACMKEKSNIFRVMRKKQTLLHTMSRKGYARLEDEMRRESRAPSFISRVDGWIKGHMREEGKSMNEVLDTTVKKVQELHKASTDEGPKSIKDDAIFHTFGPQRRGSVMARRIRQNTNDRLILLPCQLAKRNRLFDSVAMTTVSKGVVKEKVQGELASQLGLTLDEFGRAELGIPTIDGGDNEPLINLPEIGIPFTNGSNMLTLEYPLPAEDVCNECGGLPVAICAVAAALKGKSNYVWIDAHTQLKNSKLRDVVDIDKKLFSSLKLSYDFLEPKDARSCFLLCSLFSEDAEISIEDLVRYSIGMRLLDQIHLNTVEDVRARVLTLVDGLKSSCLLLDGRSQNRVKMHDVIRDVAISIAEDEKGYLVNHDIKKWPEKGTYEHYSAMSLRFTTNICELPNELECRGLHTLVLKSNNDCSRTDVPNNFFNGMENNLEVLDLSEIPLESLPSSELILCAIDKKDTKMIGLGDIVKMLCSDGVLKACKTGWSHVGYVIHYKKYIQKLQDEIIGLEYDWRRIDGSAHRARDDARVVENDVWQWLLSAYGMQAEVEVFLLDMQFNETHL
ncbi:uncharacterized protein LOC114323863 [Camellia sinensis]|uniref:uncharacterized protein LOC114323863 n=1 Tax=Camellia sinensis TaxID=4442 RepID=UPI001035E4A6|nr:uncharacterized protein LOC114323863 [Camellia sinensis]